MPVGEGRVVFGKGVQGPDFGASSRTRIRPITHVIDAYVRPKGESMKYDVRSLAPQPSMAIPGGDALATPLASFQTDSSAILSAAVTSNSPSLRHTRHVKTHTTSRLSLTLFSQELLALLSAGLSIMESLEALLEKESNPATAEMLANLQSGLRDGKRLSTVLSDQGDMFPPLYVGIISAAEHTSDLPHALSRYIAYQERIDSLREKLVSACIYPLILFVVGTCVSLFLIGYVVPRFAEVYQSAGRTLPWLSQLLLDWGRFATAHSGQLLLVLALLMLAVPGVCVKLRERGGLSFLLARIPRLGERIRIIQLSRLYLTMGMLIEGGISIVAAIDTVHGVVSNELKVHLQAAKQSVQSGEMLSNAFEANHLGTPIALRMLRVGERSGGLGQMLAQSASFYDSETSRWIDRSVRIFEPVLMAAIGIIVGTIVVMLYLPIFDLAGGLT